MQFYLCPDLEQPLYLGIDFWRKYELAPDIINVHEVTIEQVKDHFESGKGKIII